MRRTKSIVGLKSKCHCLCACVLYNMNPENDHTTRRLEFRLWVGSLIIILDSVKRHKVLISAHHDTILLWSEQPQSASYLFWLFPSRLRNVSLITQVILVKDTPESQSKITGSISVCLKLPISRYATQTFANKKELGVQLIEVFAYSKDRNKCQNRNIFWQLFLSLKKSSSTLLICLNWTELRFKLSYQTVRQLRVF